MQIAKLKLVQSLPDRPVARLEVEETKRVGFDQALIPEDTWEGNLAEGEYEMDSIRDVRLGWKNSLWKNTPTVPGPVEGS